MSIDQYKAWQCDYCPTETVQKGPRARSVPLIPPEDWHYISITKLIPTHLEEDSKGSRTKIKDQLDDIRRVVCPKCRFLVDKFLKSTPREKGER